MGENKNVQRNGDRKHDTFDQRGTNVPTLPTVPKMPVKKGNNTTNKEKK